MRQLLWKSVLRWLLVTGLTVLLGGCSQIEFAYIEIVPHSAIATNVRFTELDMIVRTWPEFGVSSECKEDSEHEMTRFRLLRDNSIFIATILNARTNTVVLAFAQYGAHAFTSDAQDLLLEVANRTRRKFGEINVVVRVDKRSGKDVLEQSIKADRGRFPLCG